MTAGSHSGDLATVVVLVAMQVRVEASQVGLLPVPSLSPPVKATLGRAWPAAQALPHYAFQVCAWAWVSASALLPRTALSASLLLPLPLLSGQATCELKFSSTTALSSVYCLLRFLQGVMVL
jgi:hypothetical protein